MLVFIFFAVAACQADPFLRVYGFLSHSAPAKPLVGEDWMFQKAVGVDLFGAGISLNPSPLQSNFAVFQTTYATAYDVQIGLHKNLVGLYLGKHGALISSEKYEFLTPQYAGLYFDADFGKLSIRTDAQYGFGAFTKMYIPLEASAPIFQDRKQDYSVMLFAPQFSYRLLKKLHLGVSFGIEKYSFMSEANVFWNIGLIYGAPFQRIFAASRSIKTGAPEQHLIRKPNIYLYPESSMQVDVQLYPRGHITASIPDYASGWSVLAEPNGHIAGTAGFLFYEAQVPLVKPPVGWCPAVEELESFCIKILAAYGFYGREITDFLDYWLPILNEAPFYEIRPIVNEQLDLYCPISILPAPDNLMRVWLLFTPVDFQSELPRPIIPSFERAGFVATEWGGAVLP